MASESDGPGRVSRLDARGLADLAAACGSPAVVARWRAKLVTVEGSECVWFVGAVSGAGHGRFWLSDRRVVVAHRFAFALAYGVGEAAQVAVLSAERWPMQAEELQWAAAHAAGQQGAERAVDMPQDPEPGPGPGIGPTR